MAERDRDSFVGESLEKWAPLFVANGVDHDNLSRLRERIDGWDDWCQTFAAVGDEYADLGEAALDRGHHLARPD